ncbi:MAG: PIN domain-containing protein [Symploca sp. SIO2D2]|nr:PIN domain-containing protein [Symploca sp. SIO2D2]
MQILVDADMVLEALLNRSGFVGDSEDLLDILQTQHIQGYISELGLEKIYSVVSKLKNPEVAEEVVSEIRAIMLFCSVNSKLLQQARLLNIRDFESAVEVACTTAMNIGAIVTQDPQNFVGADLPVLSLGNLLKRQYLERSWNKNTSPILLVGDLLEIQRLEELLEKSSEFFGNILYQSNEELNQSNFLTRTSEYSNEYARKNFDLEVSEILGQKNPEARNALNFIQIHLHHFHLYNYSSLDILNEAYLRGVNSIEQGKQIKLPLAWLKCTALHIIREISRKQNKTWLVNFSAVESILGSTLVVASPEVEEEQYQVQILNKAFRHLATKDRRIIHLRFVKGLSWQEVGKHLVGLGEAPQSNQALRSRGRRALNRLRHILLSESKTDN